jgi:enoyl-CoA hydratase/carnithine racemase
VLPTPKTFRFSLEAGVGLLTLDNPRTLNSLTFESYAELRDFLPLLSREQEVRSVVITGEGRGFCSGGDREAIIAELFAKDAAGLLEFTRMTGALIRNLRRVRRPVIAAVNGVAVGAGAVLALACDVRIVARSARFGFVFPKVGLSGADMGRSSSRASSSAPRRRIASASPTASSTMAKRSPRRSPSRASSPRGPPSRTR